MKLKPHDRVALQLALEKYRLRDPAAKRKGAEHASYCCQCAALDLKPWQIPPMRIVDPDNPDVGRPSYQAATDGRHEAARLLREMFDLGISRWHPDPLAAIAAAKQKASPHGQE